MQAENKSHYILSPLSRVLLGFIFLVSAVGVNIPRFDELANSMAIEGIPFSEVMLIGAIIFLIAGSLSIMLGFRAKIGASLLFIFLALATYYFHDFWTLTDAQDKQIQMTHFMKNLSLMGAMLFVVVHGSGAVSLDEKFLKPKAD